MKLHFWLVGVVFGASRVIWNVVGHFLDTNESFWEVLDILVTIYFWILLAIFLLSSLPKLPDGLALVDGLVDVGVVSG